MLSPNLPQKRTEKTLLFIIEQIQALLKLPPSARQHKDFSHDQTKLSALKHCIKGFGVGFDGDNTLDEVEHKQTCPMNAIGQSC